MTPDGMSQDVSHLSEADQNLIDLIDDWRMMLGLFDNHPLPEEIPLLIIPRRELTEFVDRHDPREQDTL